MRAALLLCLVGCGRLGFDPLSNIDANANDDAAPVDTTMASCANDPRYSSPTVGNTYRIVVGDATWANARATCLAEGADLPVVDNATEAMNQLIGDWIGITDALVEGEWRTVKGDLASYLPWGPTEPNGGTGENCGRLDDATKLIETQDCEEPRDYSCECAIEGS